MNSIAKWTLTLFAWPLAAFATPPPRPVPPSPIGSPIAGLTASELAQFANGKAVFEHAFTPQEGLGPLFNQAACSTCHLSPVTGGADNGNTNNVTHYMVFNGDNIYAGFEFGGPVLQKASIAGMPGAGTCALAPDSLPAIPQLRTSNRNTPPVFGFGLLDAVADEEILEWAGSRPFKDPSVLGMPNGGVELAAVGRYLGFALDAAARTQPLGAFRVGRFGWKAQTGTLFQFSNEPFNIELGVTSPYFKRENTPNGQPVPAECQVPGKQPNDVNSTNSIALYQFQALLAPPPPKQLTPTAAYGGVLFFTTGCAQCHRPTLKTAPAYYMAQADGTVKKVEALSNKLIAPYSDLLVHDMGPGLEDGRVMGLASGLFWRTTPLWGIRFKKQYLHDGSALTEHDAIIRHGGEGTVSTNRYLALSHHQQQALIEFVESL